MVLQRKVSKALASASAWPDPVKVSTRDLVAHSREARFLSLRSGKIRSQMTGGYLSPFRGRGMEFVEARPYQPGDDIRHLDWRLTARSGRPHSKVFREERERAVFMWLDLRPAMFFATRGAYKSVVAAHAAALLAWSSILQGDRVGGLFFSDQQQVEQRPGQGKSGALSLIRNIVSHSAWQAPYTTPESPLPLSEALVKLRRVVRSGSLVFLLSDMRGFDAEAELQLGYLSRHSDVVLCCIYDQLETNLPPAGTYRVSNGLKTFTLHSGQRTFREQYAAGFAQRMEMLEQACGPLGIQVLPLQTHDDLLKTLQKGLGNGNGSVRR